MASPTRPVTEIQIGGVAYRVQSSADTSELSKLAAVVEARLSDLPASQRQDHRSLVLVALSLAHDLEQERAQHRALRASVAQRLTGLVERIDDALDHRDENGVTLPAVPRLEVTGQTTLAASSIASPDQQAPNTSTQADLLTPPFTSPRSPDLTSHPSGAQPDFASDNAVGPDAGSISRNTEMVQASRLRKLPPKSKRAGSDADPSTHDD